MVSPNVDEFWGVEVPLYFPKLYAGTTDCVGIHQKDESIMDFKQTNKPKRAEVDHRLLLATCGLCFGTQRSIWNKHTQRCSADVCETDTVDDMGNRPTAAGISGIYTGKSKILTTGRTSGGAGWSNTTYRLTS
jgi:hypothetical protein